MYSPPAFRICSESFEDTKLCTTNLQIPVIFTIINVKYRVVFFSYLLWFHSCRTSFNCIFLMLWTENRKMPLYLSEHFRIWNILENVKKWLALQILTCIIIHNHVQSRIITCPLRGKRFTVCTEITIILGTVRFTIRGGRLRYKRYDAHFLKKM